MPPHSVSNMQGPVQYRLPGAMSSSMQWPLVQSAPVTHDEPTARGASPPQASPVAAIHITNPSTQARPVIPVTGIVLPPTPPRTLTSARPTASYFPSFGAVAQLGERLNGIEEADGSTPFSSTKALGFCSVRVESTVLGTIGSASAGLEPIPSGRPACGRH